MAAFVSDTFTDTASTTLASHTGETGATWTKIANALSSGIPGGDTMAISGAGISLATNVTNTNSESRYTASGAPATADYSVSCEITTPASFTRAAGITGRDNGDTATRVCYCAEIENSGALYNAVGINLLKSVGGTLSVLGNSNTPGITSGTTYTVLLSMVGTTISAKVNGTQYLSVTDSAISAKNKTGVWTYNNVSTQATFDNFVATDIGILVPAIPDRYFRKLQAVQRAASW